MYQVFSFTEVEICNSQSYLKTITNVPKYYFLLLFTKSKHGDVSIGDITQKNEN